MHVPIGSKLSLGGHNLFEIDSQKHTLVTGKSGVGKSTLLVNVAAWHIRNGDGLLFIDPHGDAADKVLSHIPKSRIRDVILIDPSAKKVPGLNIFDYDDDEDKERATQAFLTMMKSIAQENWGPETERILNAASSAVLSHFKHPTVLHIYLFVARQRFRAKIAEETHDSMLKDFIEQYDKELRPSERMSKFSPPMNKLDKFTRPGVRTLIGQGTSIDFLDAMDSRKIIIARLPKGELGALASSIVGSVIVSHLAISSLRRNGLRAPFVAVIDEVHNFVHGIDLPTLLAEARKYGVTLFLATQNLAQLPTPSAVFGNCSNLITFRMGGKDADIMAQELGDPLLTQPIVNLPDRTFYASVVRDGTPILGKNIDALPPFKRLGDEADKRAVIKVSRMRYGKKRKELDAKILKFLSQ
jgi:DNA helicase HerA-like ATPase